jgi:hypothetical protein
MSRIAGVSRKLPGFFVLRQQQFDLPPQVIVSAACNVEECLPRFWPTLQRRVEEPLCSSPTFLVHGNSVLAVSQYYALTTLLAMRWRSFSELWTSEKPRFMT